MAPALPARDPIDWTRDLEFVLSLSSILPSLERAAEVRQLLELDRRPPLAELDSAWLFVLEAALDWLAAVEEAAPSRPAELPRFARNDLLCAAIATRPPVARRPGSNALRPFRAAPVRIEDRPPVEHAWQRRADLAG